MPFRIRSNFPFLAYESRPNVPAVRIIGALGMRSPLAPAVGMSGTVRALEYAYALPRSPAVALVINSPGGSPVQSHLLFRRIRALAEKHDKTTLAFVEDVAASGGYMIACAADEIVVDPASLVGSIGVVSAGFGFQGLLERLGVERRVHTAGDRKAILDPFSPERPEDVEHLRTMQAEIHDHFVALVKERRGDRLSAEEELFNGLFWTGTKARELGLADGLGTLHDVVRERFGPEMRIRSIDPSRRPFFRRLFFGFGEAAAAGAMSAADQQAEWMRYRL